MEHSQALKIYSDIEETQLLTHAYASFTKKIQSDGEDFNILNSKLSMHVINRIKVEEF